MNMDQALHEIGVRNDTLSSEEKHFLDVNGYLPFENILTQEQIGNLIRRLDELGNWKARMLVRNFIKKMEQSG